MHFFTENLIKKFSFFVVVVVFSEAGGGLV